MQVDITVLSLEKIQKIQKELMKKYLIQRLRVKIIEKLKDMLRLVITVSYGIFH